MFEIISDINGSNLDKSFEEKVAEMESCHNDEVSRSLQRHMMEHQRFMNEHEQVHLLNALNF